VKKGLAVTSALRSGKNGREAGRGDDWDTLVAAEIEEMMVTRITGSSRCRSSSGLGPCTYACIPD
jgi:hypothetical protein